METEVDAIVPVDQGEAQKLIELIEMLFEEWYIARAKREAQLAEIKGIAEKIELTRKADAEGSGNSS